MTEELRTNDRQLSAGDIGVLENAGQVVHFFAQLDYGVDASLPLDHAALGMDTEDMRQQIRAIRRVGQDPEDGDIVIYLLEVRSVTVALTGQIARRFRERPENALLVLTSDYESLDFVLIDREVTAGKRIGSGLRQIIRPRTLTVHRRNPSPVNLRVLKRFTFTEADYLDFSTSVVSYAKAVEAMLYHRVFVRFRAESGATDADCKNKFLQQFMREERKLTLGSIAIILPSSKEAALRAFVERLYPRAGDTFFGAGGVVERLQDERIIALRNQAAHDQTLGRADARAARGWALGILQYL